jgi:hypothetical protein
MTRRVAALAITAVMWAGSSAMAQGTSPLHGSLVPGPHGVGFTILDVIDPTRYSRPERDANGPIDLASRARQLKLHVWYPARPGGAAMPMTFSDAMTAHLAGRPAEELARRAADVRTFLGQFGPVPDRSWSQLLSTPLLARREAAAADGRFPLIVGQLRPLSTSVTNEYLASHGYVVAMVRGDEGAEPADAGAGLEIATRDMEVAIAELRKRPYVDPGALAALGFSGAGFSQILLAMRHPDIDAVCDLESAIFDDRLMWPLQRGWGYDVTALRVPFLHTYSVPLSRLERRIEDFEQMRYSTRYRYLVDAPGIHHWDFATEGMAASTVLGNRGEQGPRLRQAFETTNRYVLAFFNAYVKQNTEELSFLRRSPEANGAPAGLATIREMAAIEPAPTSEAFQRIVAERGIAAAMSEFEAARARDPQAALFREDRLNALAYRLLRSQKGPEAIVIFRRIVELFPASSNAYDSLSEALETTGARAEALEVARKGLEVLERQDLAPDARGRIADLLHARLKRLS